MTFNQFWQPLAQVCDEHEAKSIARLVMDIGFGLSTADIVMGRVETLEDTALRTIRQRLLKGEPVQYVLGKAEFGNLLFRVDSHVLIPRPETLWLCTAVCQDIADTPCSVLDIGTGSGCIAVTIAHERPTAQVTAWDISDGALGVARQNAEKNGVNIDFKHQDALCPPDDHDLWHAIVSNPPYICRQEEKAMECNVLDHEPHLALFVPDDDPLLFYRSIARYAVNALKPGGTLYLEINPLYAAPLSDLLTETGFCRVSIRQDDYGKDRYALAWKDDDGADNGDNNALNDKKDT